VQRCKLVLLQVRMVRSGSSKQPLVEDGESGFGVKGLLQWAKAALGGDATAAHAGVCALVQEQVIRKEVLFCYSLLFL